MDCSETIKKRLEWILCSDTLSPPHLEGVEEFLSFAFSDYADEDELVCPCTNCHFGEHKTRKEIREDLLGYGMVKSYVRWIYHGEFIAPAQKKARNDLGEGNFDDMFGMINDAFGHQEPNVDEELGENVGQPSDSPRKPRLSLEQFEKLIKDAEQRLYPGCQKFSKLSFIVKLFQIKCVDGLTNKAFSNLLKLFKQALPEGETLPPTYHKAMKVMQDLGLSYEKIDACENDCILFWKENANLTECKVCGSSRWEDSKSQTSDEGNSVKRKKIPRKILRYFPLIPRLQRMFMSPETASSMRWHSEVRDDEEGVLRHPADGEEWKNFDKTHSSFSSEARNVRLGLASDGFNPFGVQRSDHSTWPVVLTINNLPPWMCTKQPYLILSLLIPGPKAPGNNIDVYLRPLVDELKELWEPGIETYDASKCEYFRMRAALQWTINDFPAYANLSGWSTKGYKACPCCGEDPSSIRLPNCGKICYMGHRRFLPLDHKWRDSKTWNNKVDRRPPPEPPSEADLLTKLSELEGMRFGKTQEHPKRADDNWRKKSIFFELPYWSGLKLRHNLDVMHIEKNVFDSILGTLLHIQGKTKDHIKARHDPKVLKIRKDLQPKLINGKWHIPAAKYTLSPEEKDEVCRSLEEIKVPDGYSSNFSKCIRKRKVSGLKSHDCHVLLEQLLPLAIRGVCCQEVYDVLVEISKFFKQLCSKTLKVVDLDRLEKKIVITLCKLEKIFLPSFFDVMVHLCVHLVGEAKAGGPVHYRWMYPIERYLRKLKCYVRNKARPEGSMAEGYILDECLFFCSKYLHDIETKSNQRERNSDGVSDDYEGISVFAPTGIPLGKEKSKNLSNEEWEQARDYVLKNCDEVQPYLREFEEGMFDVEFSEWLRERVNQLSSEETEQVIQQSEEGAEHTVEVAKLSEEVKKDLKSLAMGPLQGVERYTGYVANGFRFHIKRLEESRKHQNSGVMVLGDLGAGNVDYYGVLTEIISLQYLNGKRVILFNCDWWDVHTPGRGVKVDKHGFISINPMRKFHTNEPYVLASQSKQVFYVKDGLFPNWVVVVKTQARHHYDVPSGKRSNKNSSETDSEAHQQEESRTSPIDLSVDQEDDEHAEAGTFRDDIEPLVVEADKDNEPKSPEEEQAEIPEDDFEDEIPDFDESDDENEIHTEDEDDDGYSDGDSDTDSDL